MSDVSRLVVITNSESSLAAEALGPESLKGWRSARHAVMGEQEPETEDWFGKDVQNGVSDDFLVDIDHMATFGETPNNWVDRPQDESEASDGCVEGLRLAVLVGNGSTAIHGQLVDHDQVGNTGPNIPTPGLAVLGTERSEQTSQYHNHIGDDGDQDVSTTEASQKGQIQQEEWGSNSPVDVSCPVDLSLVVLICVWNTLVMDSFGVCVVASAIPSGHGVVGEECKSSDEGSQDVEQAFLHRNTESHAIEGERGDSHEDDDDPESPVSHVSGLDSDDRVRDDRGNWGHRRGG